MSKNIKSEKDAYGQEVLAYLEGRKSYELVERDDGYIEFSGGAKAYFAEFKNWPSYQKQAIKLVKGRVLDVGCGAGRVSLYLQKKWFEVLGIDNSPLAIEVCKRRGVKRAKVLHLEKIGEIKESFDTIVMFGNNFGLFGNYKKAKRLLKMLHEKTSEDALIIAESADPYKTTDPVHLAYHRRNRKKGRMVGQLRIRVRFRDFVGNWFEYLLVSKKEMRDIIKGTGWEIKKFINSGKFMYIAIIEKAK